MQDTTVWRPVHDPRPAGLAQAVGGMTDPEAEFQALLIRYAKGEITFDEVRERDPLRDSMTKAAQMVARQQLAKEPVAQGTNFSRCRMRLPAWFRWGRQ